MGDKKMKIFTVQEPEHTAKLEDGKATFFYRGEIYSTTNISDEGLIQDLLNSWAALEVDLDLMINIVEDLQKQYLELTNNNYGFENKEDVYNFMLSEDVVDIQVNRIEEDFDDSILNNFRDIQRDFIDKVSEKLGFE